MGAAGFQRSVGIEGDDDDPPPTDIPQIAPRNPDDELKDIKLRVNRLQFPVGFRYYPWQKGRFRLHLGAGVAPSLGLPSSFLRYEFEDNDEEYTLSALRVLSTRLRLGAVYGSLGLQAGVGKRWQIGLTATAQQPLDSYQFDYQRPSWGRLRLGVGYGLR